jgi:hypothetical protein
MHLHAELDQGQTESTDTLRDWLTQAEHVRLLGTVIRETLGCGWGIWHLPHSHKGLDWAGFAGRRCSSLAGLAGCQLPVPQAVFRQGRVLLSVRARAISSPSDLPAAPTSIVLPTEAAPPPAVYQRVGTQHSAMQHVHVTETEVHAPVPPQSREGVHDAATNRGRAQGLSLVRPGG